MKSKRCAGALEARSKAVAEKVAQAVSDCGEIEKQILLLIRSRTAILKGVEEIIQDACCVKSCFGIDSERIFEEYEKSGFSSNVVKGAVGRVRDLFFDDEVEGFRKFNCVCISPEGRAESGVRFDFSDMKSHQFRLTFDDGVRLGGARKSLYDLKRVPGEIYFSVMMRDPGARLKRSDYEPVLFSCDVAEVRSAVKEYVLGGFKAEKAVPRPGGFYKDVSDALNAY